MLRIEAAFIVSNHYALLLLRFCSEKKTLIGPISPRYQGRFDLSSPHLKLETKLIQLHLGQLLKGLL